MPDPNPPKNPQQQPPKPGAQQPAQQPMQPAGGAIPPDTHDDDVPADARASMPPESSPGRESAAGRERARRDAAAPLRAPPGAALFENTTDDPVRFTVRDEGNRPQRVECEPRGVCMVPVEYADIVPKRAPQLKERDRQARPPAPEE